MTELCERVNELFEKNGINPEEVKKLVGEWGTLYSLAIEDQVDRWGNLSDCFPFVVDNSIKNTLVYDLERKLPRKLELEKALDLLLMNTYFKGDLAAYVGGLACLGILKEDVCSRILEVGRNVYPLLIEGKLEEATILLNGGKPEEAIWPLYNAKYYVETNGMGFGLPKETAEKAYGKIQELADEILQHVENELLPKAEKELNNGTWCNAVEIIDSAFDFLNALESLGGMLPRSSEVRSRIYSLVDRIYEVKKSLEQRPAPE